MPKIVINELDLTTPGGSGESTDVVYIPGFVVSGADIKVGKPELFTSVSQFNTRCGAVAPRFAADQPYPLANDENEVGFSASATKGLSENAVMFKAETADPSYVMAKELLAAGLTVLYERVNKDSDTISVDTMYSYLSSSAYQISDIAGISDRGNYSVKYLTSGGYPTFEYDGGSIVTAMLGLAENRGDCVALIDHLDNTARTIDPASSDSVFKTVSTSTLFDTKGDFGAMFTPWATYNRVTADTDPEDDTKKVKVAFRAPGSFAYLAALADSIKTNANWLAVAGAARGGVVNLAEGGMDVIIPNGVADKLQPRNPEDDMNIAINAITNIKPYGLTIWGNRTLKPIEDGLVATSFLNVRNLISDIKKTCYRVARKVTFEQDTDILWVNFKSDIAKLLDRMKSGYGISGYKIVRDNDRPEATDKATLCAKIIIYPTYAVEDFYITVVLQDNEVSVD